MFPDPGLDRWLELIKARSGERPVLEIGCGHGDDTASLAKAGLRVIGFDSSRTSVASTKVRVPSARIERRDVRNPLPEDAKDLGVALASLSLHYFAWEETVSIVDRVRLALRLGGVLLCRLNSTEDTNFCADGCEEIEPNYLSLPCITTLSALKGQPWQFLDATGEIVKVSVRSRYRVNSGELALAGARQGIGFAIVAAYPCQILPRADCGKCRWTCALRRCNCLALTATGIP